MNEETDPVVKKRTVLLIFQDNGNDILKDFSIYKEQVKNSNSITTPSPSPSPSTPPQQQQQTPRSPLPSFAFPIHTVPLPPIPIPTPTPPAPTPLVTRQPFPEQPTTSTASSPPFLAPSAPQSPQSSNEQRPKNGEKTDKRRAGGAGTREVHNKLEKNRRAHMKEMFEYLRSQIPQLEDKKNSNLSILRNANRYIQTLRRREKEHEVEIQKLAQQKIAHQEKLRYLKMDISYMNIECIIKEEPDSEDIDTYSTSTASEGDGPVMSDVEEEFQEEIKDNPERLENLERKIPVITSQTLPTVIGTASSRMTFATSSSVMSATPLSPGTIKPLKNNIGFPTVAPTVITNNTVSATNIIHNNSNSIFSTNNIGTIQRPVREILHKTLAQRKALQKQPVGNSTISSHSELSSTQVTTIQATKTFRTATHMKPQNSIRSVIPLPTTSVKPGLQSAGIKLATLTIPVNKPTKVAIAPHKKIVVETSPVSVPTGVSVTTALSSSATSTPSSSASASVSSALTALVRTPTAHPIVSQTVPVPVMSTVKQILAPAGSQIVSGSPLAVNPLLGQSITRTQILNTSILSSPSVSTSTTSSNQISSMHPVMSLTPVSQLVPPTAQLNMFPIIQSQLFPTNQVVGQSVAKPLVMVTVPTTTTVQVSVAMTPTTT